jgi:Core-2/I-Branching enzyme
MSKIAYLVFAYKNPQLLKRAIKTLSTGHCAFFVHIDQKIDIGQFSCISGDNVFFTDKRVVVYWGEFSGIDAILLLIRQALGRPERYDHFVLLSGSEYPLRSSRYIHTFLEENQGLEFISLMKMPSPGKPISRISTLRLESDQPVRRMGWRVLAKVGLAERDYRQHLGGLEPYSGITWWTLSRNACEYVVRFTESKPHVERFFRDTFAPEESFIHTILGNSPLRDRVRGNSLFEDWTPPGGDTRRAVRGHLPQNLTSQHVAFFEAQDKVWLDDFYGRREALFARKFSDDKLDLVDRLDQMTLRKEERSLGTEDCSRPCGSGLRV